MDLKENFQKIDGAKVLSILVTVLGVAGTLLSSQVEKNNQKALKKQLKDEIIQELSNNQD